MSRFSCFFFVLEPIYVVHCEQPNTGHITWQKKKPHRLQKSDCVLCGAKMQQLYGVVYVYEIKV